MAKIKMKTNKGAAKRFKKTASGKIKRRHSLTSHILTKKSSKRKRKLRKPEMIKNKAEQKKIKRMLPY